MFDLPRSSAATGGVGSQEGTDVLRRLTNLLRMGKVHSADYPAARIRVVVGDASDPVGHIVTNWIPWLTTRAGKDRTWHAPEVGETVLVLAPGGELANAVALPATFSSGSPAPADRETVQRTIYDDGTVVEYDREAHKLSADVKGDAELTVEKNVSVKASGNISIEASGPVAIKSSASVSVTAPAVNISASGGSTKATMTGSFSLNGRLDVTGGDVTADGISLKGHTHIGDSGGRTGPPG
ncbi:phage baseplate assembly protein V [Azospirillum sp. TSH64]|uniref:phage baseplate assembly protein V n=1 Tax=Azospirillum sp. TSH64 TaxID=652740 RepID=UPI000D60CF56|nr:phage baseplate assembly protein V [Azospirillum sp. TSH64]PWC81254.1 hypothetical protein TSH64_01005 [Azospirillum sp. TSH64]